MLSSSARAHCKLVEGAFPELVEGACPELVEGACPELVEGFRMTDKGVSS